MEALEQFLHMGGYAAYVWSAYAITLVVLALNAARAQFAERRELAQLARHLHSPSSHHDATT